MKETIFILVVLATALETGMAVPNRPIEGAMIERPGYGIFLQPIDMIDIVTDFWRHTFILPLPPKVDHSQLSAIQIPTLSDENSQQNQSLRLFMNLFIQRQHDLDELAGSFYNDIPNFSIGTR